MIPKLWRMASLMSILARALSLRLKLPNDTYLANIYSIMCSNMSISHHDSFNGPIYNEWWRVNLALDLVFLIVDNPKLCVPVRRIVNIRIYLSWNALS